MNKKKIIKLIVTVITILLSYMSAFEIGYVVSEIRAEKEFEERGLELIERLRKSILPLIYVNETIHGDKVKYILANAKYLEDITIEVNNGHTNVTYNKAIYDAYENTDSEWYEYANEKSERYIENTAIYNCTATLDENGKIVVLKLVLQE